MRALLLLSLCSVAYGLQSGDEQPLESSKGLAAALNVVATVVLCMSPTQRQRFQAALHLATA